jgi:betaine/carnitine transporter, BCCT family
MKDTKIDWISFHTCIALMLVLCVPLIAFPGKGGAMLESVFRYVVDELGILYLLASVSCIGLLTWLALGRFGKVKLAEHDEAPEFTTISWIAMLFCGGIGAGLMYWCGIEWTYYYASPPFGAAPRSPAAAEWASTYGMYHWGITAWAIYCLPTLAIAYPYYTRKLPWLRFSNSCHRFLRGRELGATARFIDFWLIVAIIAGAGSSLAFCTPMIAACIGWLFGLQTGLWLSLVVIGLSVAIFATSVWLGLKKGMKNLSDLTLVLTFVFLGFVLIAGPTVFLLKASVNSVGVMLQNYIRMNFWTDPYTHSGFVENWTIFYWAWWMSYAPFTGLFITRISRGRTIREVVTGMLVFGSLGCALFYMVVGNYAMSLELTGQVDVSSIVQNDSGANAIVAVLEQLPLAWGAIAVFTLVSLAYSATTYDAAAQALAASLTLGLREGEDPARWLRVFWALAIGILPATLMYVGGLKVVQTVIIASSLPILAICVVMTVALLKDLFADHPVRDARVLERS